MDIVSSEDYGEAIDDLNSGGSNQECREVEYCLNTWSPLQSWGVL
jgi:hypothetical protein